MLDRTQLRTLVQKYASRAPRYTSYPTAADFSSSFANADWQKALSEEEYSHNPYSSLYVHIPFCPILCFFCACNKVITKNHRVVRPYIDALKKELASYASLPHALIIDQLHWGGGSPNYLNPEEMQEVFEAMSATFPQRAPHADVSVELDPRTTTHAQLTMLRTLGFNRVSLGVQDFDPVVQKNVNRKQSYEITADLIAQSRTLGFSSVNTDLIYGLPGQTPLSFEKTLTQLIALRPDRIALYGYAHVTWISKAQQSFDKKLTLPSPDERIELLLTGIERLTDAGYRYIGMDHFALPTDSLTRSLDEGTMRRNFMGYSTHKGTRILAFGPSAISSTHTAFAQNEKDLATYQSRVAQEGFAIDRGIARSQEDQLRGEVIEQLMCEGRLSFAAFEKRWKVSFWNHFKGVREKLNSCVTDGLLTIDDNEITLTFTGRLLMRPIAVHFDAYRKESPEQSARSFSQTV